MASRRLALIGFGVVAGIGLLGLLAAAITTKTDVVQTLGVNPLYAVAPLHPNGGTVCEDPIVVADPITNVRVNLGTHGQPGVPFDLDITNTRGVTSHGHVAGGWIDNGKPQTVPVPRVAAGQSVKVCITNRGPRWAFAFGDIGVPPAGVFFPSGSRPTITPTAGEVDGTGLQGDISLQFVSTKKRSLISRVPEMFRRASVFRPGFVGPWTYWLLLAAVLIVAPLALVRALTASLRAEPDSDSEAPPRETNGHHPSGTATVDPLPAQPQDAAAPSRGSRD